MVVNFRTCGISRGARKLVWTPTLIKKISHDISGLRHGIRYNGVYQLPYCSTTTYYSILRNKRLLGFPLEAMLDYTEWQWIKLFEWCIVNINRKKGGPLQLLKCCPLVSFQQYPNNSTNFILAHNRNYPSPMLVLESQQVLARAEDW